MKKFKGDAIYNPSGKAGEYSYWACNFYVGCSNACTYCYLRTGIGKKYLGGDKPTLKKCFKNEEHALKVFEKESNKNLPELQEHGLFFSFSTDPMLYDEKTDNGTLLLTIDALTICIKNHIPVKILTKSTGKWVEEMEKLALKGYYFLIQNLAFGFTLTGHDEMEPCASTNAERIEAMRKLYDAGFKTWASIEPIIDFCSSAEMIRQTLGCCDLYKIGLESGKKYDRLELRVFVSYICTLLENSDFCPKVYFKDGLLKAACICREDLPEICVTRDYNIFFNGK
jgi:DNA repair photolyase